MLRVIINIDEFFIHVPNTVILGECRGLYIVYIFLIPNIIIIIIILLYYYFLSEELLTKSKLPTLKIRRIKTIAIETFNIKPVLCTYMI